MLFGQTFEQGDSAKRIESTKKQLPCSGAGNNRNIELNRCRYHRESSQTPLTRPGALEAIASFRYGTQALTPDHSTATLTLPITTFGDSRQCCLDLLQLPLLLVREDMEDFSRLMVGGNVGPMFLYDSGELLLAIARLLPDAQEGIAATAESLSRLTRYLVHSWNCPREHKMWSLTDSGACTRCASNSDLVYKRAEI